MRTQAVVRYGAVSFDREGNRVESQATARDLIVVPTVPLEPRQETTQSPMILTRAEIARRRDAHKAGD